MIGCSGHDAVPDAANSFTGFLVIWAMKPTMEKMTKPANMLVQELMKHTMMESLKRKEPMTVVTEEEDATWEAGDRTLLPVYVVVIEKYTRTQASASVPTKGQRTSPGSSRPLVNWVRHRIQLLEENCFLLDFGGPAAAIECSVIKFDLCVCFDYCSVSTREVPRPWGICQSPNSDHAVKCVFFDSKSSSLFFPISELMHNY
ncbi:hypothetical protein EYF80_045205 [Liparis tanakae]|uniref:Uncharacterized protein n=1 Tax=Liparis tanakae TaxID=230148 RepID=A0A4Z2FUX2_9TELE|nr:hypothetical protein EYF80_045205 [Liparis tanakae]